MNETKRSIKPAVLVIAAALLLGAVGGYFVNGGNVDWPVVLRASGAVAIVTLLLVVLGSAARLPKFAPYVALVILWTLAIFGTWNLLQ